MRVHGANPADLGHNHQVLAYGYEDAGSLTTVHIYDPNWPDDDGVTITFGTGHPEHTTDFTHSRDTAPPILGFFVTPYARRNPVHLFSSTSTWVNHPGSARDIGACDQSVWAVGGRPVPGGHGIYRWNGSGWDGVDGGAVRIAVAPDGSPWVVNDAGGIFQRAGSQWHQVPGGAHDIGVGADGSVWVVGTDPVPGGHGIYRWNGSGWDGVDGGAVRIAVAPDGSPWVVNDAGGIFQWPGAGGTRCPAEPTTSAWAVTARSGSSAPTRRPAATASTCTRRTGSGTGSTGAPCRSRSRARARRGWSTAPATSSNAADRPAASTDAAGR